MTIHPILLSALLADSIHLGKDAAASRHGLGRFNVVGTLPSDVASPNQTTSSLELNLLSPLAREGLSLAMVCWTFGHANGTTAGVGREADNAIILADAAMGRHHAEFGVDSDGPWVRDLGSKTGTWLHEKRQEAGAQVRLKDGHRLRLGGSYLVMFSTPRLLDLLTAG